MGLEGHIVQLYDSEAYLYDVVAAFFARAEPGTPCVAIATEAHRLGIVERLGVVQRGAPGQLVGPLFLLDAEDMLARLMDRGALRRDAVALEIEELLRRVGAGRVRVFSELVDLLCRRRDYESARHVESSWRELQSAHGIHVLCGFPMARFDRRAAIEPFRQLCELHTCANPTERFSAAGDAEGHLALIEQQLRALELEVAGLTSTEGRPVDARVSRVLIAGGTPLTRAAIAALLARETSLEVIDQVSDEVEQVLQACALRPDLVLVDASVGGNRGLDAITALKRRAPEVRIVVLAHETTPNALLRSLRAALEHDLVTTSDAPASILVPPPSVLSAREREVLSLLALGNTNKEIAGRLGISVKTVETHRQKVTNKLGRRSRSDLVHYATRAGLVGGEDTESGN